MTSGAALAAAAAAEANQPPHRKHPRKQSQPLRSRSPSPAGLPLGDGNDEDGVARKGPAAAASVQAALAALQAGQMSLNQVLIHLPI